MSYYSLPLKKNKVEVPENFCYLVISKYSDNHFSPRDGKKKLTLEELKKKKEAIQDQENTLKQLDTGYFNAYNNKIELSNILNSRFTSSLYNSNDIIYKVKPILAYSKSDNYYSRECKYFVSEFNIVEKFKNKEDVIKQIQKDNLLDKFSAIVFEDYSYGNEGYKEILYSYFKYIKDTYPDDEMCLSDIMLTNDYNHNIKNNFSRKDIYETSRENIRYLLNNKLINYLRKYDYIKSLIVGLIDCKIFDVALECVKLITPEQIGYLIKFKDFDEVIRKWSTEDDIKEIIKLLNYKMSGVMLTVLNDYDKVIETKTFDNIGDLKTYIIKTYDISFETIMKKDVSDITTYIDDDEIKFEIS